MKVLSLNLCASWTTPRADRLRAVAKFVKENEIDLLLVQEGLRSCYIYDTIRQFAGMLGYGYFAKSTFGFPVFWEFRVGIVSRFKIIDTVSLAAEVPQQDWLDSIPLPWRRRAVAATVDVPGLGITTLISVHLTSSPKTQEDRVAQFKKLFEWLPGLPDSDVRVVGGDFNTSQENPAFMATFGGAVITGQSPDYICVDGAKIVKGYPVLTGQVVTDHECGVIGEVEK